MTNFSLLAGRKVAICFSLVLYEELASLSLTKHLTFFFFKEYIKRCAYSCKVLASFEFFSMYFPWEFLTVFLYFLRPISLRNLSPHLVMGMFDTIYMIVLAWKSVIALIT